MQNQNNVRITARALLFAACLPFVALFTLAHIAVAGSVDDIRFPEENWSQPLINSMEVPLNFLDKSFSVSLDAPAKNSSQAVNDELAYLRDLQEKRTPEQVELIKKENATGVIGPFADRGFIKPETHTNTLFLLARVDRDMAYFTIREKLRYQRPRPSQLAGDLEPAIENPPHASYPSGHAAQAFVIALVLSMLDPRREDDYKELARDIAWRRELAGVHYPGDSAAGRKLAQQVFEELKKNDKFNAMLDRAGSEFKVDGVVKNN